MRIHRAVNLRTRPDRYTIDPADFVRAQQSADRLGLEVVGVYHSHPDRAPTPSTIDAALGWPVYVYLIVEVRKGGPGSMRAWSKAAQDATFEPVAIRPCAVRNASGATSPSRPSD